MGFSWIHRNGGICLENSYPYKAADGTCQTSCSPAVNIKWDNGVPPNNDKALQAAVARAPISVGVDASKWQFYKGGILDDPTCGQYGLDHAVLAVGYGTANGQEYWKVKNSWGLNWGEDGYILLARNTGSQPAGMCGILSTAYYPTHAHSV